MATNDPINLTASRTCETCRGKGWVREAYGEVVDCDCAFDSAPDTPEAQRAIDEGRFTIAPAPEYIAEMAALDRQQSRMDQMRNEDAWIDNALHSACEGDCGE